MPTTIDLTDDLVAQYEALERELDGLRTNQRAMAPALALELDEARTLLEQSTLENSRLQHEISRLQAELAAIKAAPCSECEALKRDLHASKQQAAAENRQWEQRLRQETGSLREQLSQAASASSNATSKRFEDDLASARQESQRYQEKARDSQTQADKLRADVGKLEARSKAIQTEYDELRVNWKQQANDIQRLKKELVEQPRPQEAPSAPADGSVEIKLREELARMEEQLKAKQADYAEKVAENKVQANQIQRLKNELRDLRKT